MSRMIIKYSLVIILITLSVVSDIKTYKIKNKVVFPFMIIGILLNTFFAGYEGAINALLGTIIPIFLLIILYALRMLGAGDIKLFSAIGAIIGYQNVLMNMAYSFLSGGVIALGIIYIHNNGMQRIHYLIQYFKTCFLTTSIQPYTDFQDKKDGTKFRFSFAIASGTLIMLIIYFINIIINLMS